MITFRLKRNWLEGKKKTGKGRKKEAREEGRKEGKIHAIILLPSLDLNQLGYLRGKKGTFEFNNTCLNFCSDPWKYDNATWMYYLLFILVVNPNILHVGERYEAHGVLPRDFAPLSF